MPNQRTVAVNTWVALPPTRGENWAAIAVVAASAIGFAAVAPYSDTPLLRLNALFPTLDAIVFVTDLVTATLLFSLGLICDQVSQLRLERHE